MKMSEFIEKLSAHDPDEEIINIYWTAEDIIGAADSMCEELTEEEVLDVINRIEHYHDANYGINWEIIMYRIGDVVGQRG